MRRVLFLALSVAVAGGCSTGMPAAPTPVEAHLILAPGQSTDLGGGSSIAFLGVVQDSRCPINAVCVVAGEAVARFAITTPSASIDRDLRTPAAVPTVLAPLTIEFLELYPYPFAGRPTDSSDYRATLRVTLR